ncbi:HEXXH motif domain-containing protein [Herbidospora sp. NEAU-GS84]|uniref:HEXXH motif domain-containing protein n=1 Tax=Herbidospora solisilvae TaxID=2696284 RepID=A0A7C9J9X2_9ACTN|nr:HEXXH motif domain-containing protein [Herbidospora solisilvae]NAS20864.1 HEXXH motif domain-containing protein [Herbidospora solisilvae]
MSILPHRISDAAFSALASGGGGAAAAEELRSAQFSRHLMLLRGVVESFPEVKVAEEAFTVLADLQRGSGGAVETVLRYPAVGAWAAQCLRGTADPARLAAVALAAAHLAGRECRLPVTSRHGWVTLPSVGGFPATGAFDLSVGPGGIRADGDPVDGWRPLARITAHGYTVTVDDLDPHRWPDDGIDLPRLDAPERDDWQSRLREAWDVLAERHWTVRDEVATTVSVLTPIGAPSDQPQSESSREAFGAIALSAPPDGVSLAETFAHETQHVKLYALMDVVPLTLPDTGDLYYAPWRPDPRPARGLLNGTYAYLGVTGFWRRERAAGHPRAEFEFAQWREAAHEATQALLAGRGLTAEGVRFTEGMARTLGKWAGEPVDAGVLDEARRAQSARRRAWEQRNEMAARAAEGRSRY